MISEQDQRLYFGPNSMEVLIQEKIDGANLGISLNEDWQICFQNRSHYVNYETATQWSQLKTWEANNRANLMAIFEEPNRYIIFGEWCTMCHSVPYGTLPDWFLVFDIFDLRAQKFLARTVVETMCEGMFHLVPVLAKQRFANIEEISQLLDIPAAFRNDGGPLEGIYLRIEGEKYGLHRCKLVRSDFWGNIDEHWTKRAIPNKIDYSANITDV